MTYVSIPRRRPVAVARAAVLGVLAALSFSLRVQAFTSNAFLASNSPVSRGSRCHHQSKECRLTRGAQGLLPSLASVHGRDAVSRKRANPHPGRWSSRLHGAAGASESSGVETKAPSFNGKMVYPMKVLASGLSGHEVAAVYAVLNSNYKRGKSGDGWEHCEFIGITPNLGESLDRHLSERGPEMVANVRALSFAFPQAGAMEQVAGDWRKLASESGGGATDNAWTEGMVEAWLDDDDDDEIDLYDLEESGMAMDFAAQSAGLMQTADTSSISSSVEPIVSPFSRPSAPEPKPMELPSAAGGEVLEFNKQNVDKVLDEVRPYLISDGGNVAVQRVDEDEKKVYLVLEGACGSCASSTVTMQMGIERVLKENFPGLSEVVEVQDPDASAGQPSGLTFDAVKAEVDRLTPAILAMGGVIKIVNVDESGVVELNFRGSNKVQHGLELAIRDIPFVKEVKFLS